MRSADAERAHKAWGRDSDGPAWKGRGEDAAERRVGNIQRDIDCRSKCSQARLLTAVNKSKGDTGPCNGDTDCNGRREPTLAGNKTTFVEYSKCLCEGALFSSRGELKAATIFLPSDKWYIPVLRRLFPRLGALDATLHSHEIKENVFNSCPVDLVARDAEFRVLSLERFENLLDDSRVFGMEGIRRAVGRCGGERSVTCNVLNAVEELFGTVWTMSAFFEGGLKGVASSEARFESDRRTFGDEFTRSSEDGDIIRKKVGFIQELVGER